MPASRRTLLAAGALALALAAFVGVLRRPARVPAGAPARGIVLALYLDEKAAGAPPEGIPVAEIGFDEQGNPRLLRVSEKEVLAELESALREAGGRIELGLRREESAGAAGKGRALAESSARRGSPEFAWALGKFIRQRTGLRYRVAAQRAAPGEMNSASR